MNISSRRQTEFQTTNINSELVLYRTPNNIYVVWIYLTNQSVINSRWQIFDNVLTIHAPGASHLMSKGDRKVCSYCIIFRW